MPDNTSTDAEAMMVLFKGSDRAHGRSELTKNITDKGKHETKSWLEKSPVTLDDWKAHLAGAAGLGMPPLNADNKVCWGAIDVDVYKDLSIEQLNTTIQQKKLPLVICRSKSGGPHIFLFVTDWVPARIMIEKLDALAGFLGFGTSEIFPKQETISVEGANMDYGSWINMPYFGGTNYLRYALDSDNKALVTIPDFISYVRTKTVTPEQLKALEPPETPDILPDGPPCLNQLFALKPSEFRNVILSNAAVYAKKVAGANFGTLLDNFNRMFETPLDTNEVEAIKKSYSRKEYRYQCSHQPLCSYCNSSKCKKTKHGIGGANDVSLGMRSLSVIHTEPPIWYLDVSLPDGVTQRMSLTTDELYNATLFQKKCMETLHCITPKYSGDEWRAILSKLLAHVSTIEIPKELLVGGQFSEHVWDFLNNRSSEESFEDLLRGLAFRQADLAHFRAKDLWNYLSSQRFTQMKQNEMLAFLKNNMNAVSEGRQIAGKFVRYIKIPIPQNFAHHEQLATHAPVPAY